MTELDGTASNEFDGTSTESAGGTASANLIICNIANSGTFASIICYNELLFVRGYPLNLEGKTISSMTVYFLNTKGNYTGDVSSN